MKIVARAPDDDSQILTQIETLESQLYVFSELNLKLKAESSDLATLLEQARQHSIANDSLLTQLAEEAGSFK